MQVVKGKVAVVTGAGSGIGRALAIALAAKGCNLAPADINSESLKETQRLLDSNVFKVMSTLHTVDVSQWEQMQTFADNVFEQHRQVHMLINNAGVAMGALFKDASLDDMRWIMDINFGCVVYGCKAFAPRMKAAEEATIVNISSVFGLISAPMQSAYCASKFAVRSFSDALRHEVGYMGKNFKVACAFPAGVKTNIADNARLTLHANIGSTEQQERERMKKLFLTTAEDAAIDILRGIKQGKTRIKVGKGSTLIDLLSCLLPVKYTAFL